MKNKGKITGYFPFSMFSADKSWDWLKQHGYEIIYIDLNLRVVKVRR